MFPSDSEFSKSYRFKNIYRLQVLKYGFKSVGSLFIPLFYWLSSSFETYRYTIIPVVTAKLPYEKKKNLSLAPCWKTCQQSKLIINLMRISVYTINRPLSFQVKWALIKRPVLNAGKYLRRNTTEMFTCVVTREKDLFSANCAKGSFPRKVLWKHIWQHT